MGFFARLGRLIRGFFSLFIGGLEEKNPHAMLEDLKNQLNAAKIRYQTTTANIITREKIAASKLQSAEKELEEIRQKIQAARQQNDRELALHLLIQEEHLEAAYNTALEAYNSIKAEADRAREEFANFQAEVEQKMSQIRQLKVQSDLADLKKEMNALRSAYATDSGAGKINEQLKQAEEIIQTKLAKEEAIAELGQNSLDSRLRSLNASMARRRAEEKLAKLFGDEPAQTEDSGRVVKETNPN